MANENNESEVPRQESFKEQLDRAATETRDPPTTNPIVEKINQYIPAASKILGSGKDETTLEDKSGQISGPPERPVHDDKIEDFVRDQHRSKDEAGNIKT